ncbi:hypothetical protein BABINDRAFT_158956 [Babjeviella inositovora NRRL Y-12698]|uniref:Uncharacterized protein n=1 Tax=Babjeviella inositovora NRRL Y-12698 TaxID=984486 RepID=A0A1E3QXF7_9ASCO|nr:uncharacterized protein BABINDRAFT_158956 [Babjeviella inositovora NRRL Y-12698]ODQ82336.1 hypothetical protein BABINDRAFT_158956 [Babjeviella inositovora NRRL Y-12698]
MSGHSPTRLALMKKRPVGRKLSSFEQVMSFEERKPQENVNSTSPRGGYEEVGDKDSDDGTEPQGPPTWANNNSHTSHFAPYPLQHRPPPGFMVPPDSNFLPPGMMNPQQYSSGFGQFPPHMVPPQYLQFPHLQPQSTPDEPPQSPPKSGGRESNSPRSKASSDDEADDDKNPSRSVLYALSHPPFPYFSHANGMGFPPPPPPGYPMMFPPFPMMHPMFFNGSSFQFFPPMSPRTAVSTLLTASENLPELDMDVAGTACVLYDIQSALTKEWKEEQRKYNEGEDDHDSESSASEEVDFETVEYDRYAYKRFDILRKQIPGEFICVHEEAHKSVSLRSRIPRDDVSSNGYRTEQQSTATKLPTRKQIQSDVSDLLKSYDQDLIYANGNNREKRRQILYSAYSKLEAYNHKHQELLYMVRRQELVSKLAGLEACVKPSYSQMVPFASSAVSIKDEELAEIELDLSEERDLELVRLKYFAEFQKAQEVVSFLSQCQDNFDQMHGKTIEKLLNLKAYLVNQKEVLEEVLESPEDDELFKLGTIKSEKLANLGFGYYLMDSSKLQNVFKQTLVTSNVLPPPELLHNGTVPSTPAPLIFEPRELSFPMTSSESDSTLYKSGKVAAREEADVVDASLPLGKRRGGPRNTQATDSATKPNDPKRPKLAQASLQGSSVGFKLEHRAPAEFLPMIKEEELMSINKHVTAEYIRDNIKSHKGAPSLNRKQALEKNTHHATPPQDTAQEFSSSESEVLGTHGSGNGSKSRKARNCNRVSTLKSQFGGGLDEPQGDSQREGKLLNKIMKQYVSPDSLDTESIDADLVLLGRASRW